MSFGSETDSRQSWRIAHRYYLRHHHPFFYPFFRIIFILALSVGLIGVCGLVCTSFAATATGIVFTFFLVGFPVALACAVPCRQMDREARYFASEAIDDGNLTESEIAFFYGTYFR